MAGFILNVFDLKSIASIDSKFRCRCNLNALEQNL